MNLLQCVGCLGQPCGSWKLTLFIEIYNADDKVAHLWRNLYLMKTYKAIASVATGRIPYLFCGFYI